MNENLNFYSGNKNWIKMSSIEVNDILDELLDENRRLLNELSFTVKCVDLLNEIKI